ncbi:hypothetical protein EZ313_18600 [Ramlibacter henchirensis]|uniref:Uncharacterized protein n=1 Tax=Ramlibacter henchirensis TaxID=204072 RepID=A0A4Z0BPZ7_9BURK|nr:hypothetical protein [Ramlibacter henchirensis]TFZ00470.1 hypothetical protein EZ313_18600 [Ramlibacter henchirensis]
MADSRVRFVELSRSGALALQQCRWENDAIVLALLLEPCEDAPKENWAVRIEQPFEERLSGGWVEPFGFADEHPVLLPWKEDQCDIYFTDNALSAASLLGIVAMACSQIVGDWLPASRFLNNGLNLVAGERSPHGLLGRFPRSLASAILSQLPQDSIRAVLVNSRPPHYWDGIQFVAYPDDLQVLTFGSSFVVGAGFTFTGP